LTASAILPWSLRAKQSASVAMPVTWAELKKVERADQFSLLSAARRKDSWPKFFTLSQRIDKNVLAHLRKGGSSATPAKKRTGKA
jgi:bifunctional non-homologous end joining protein LigD